MTTPALTRLATNDVERMIKEYQANPYDRDSSEANATKQVARIILSMIKYKKEQLVSAPQDEVHYPVLVKELRLDRARYRVVMARLNLFRYNDISGCR